MMRTLAILFVLIPAWGSAQNSFSNLDSTLSFFFQALEEKDNGKRSARFDELFKPKAQINAITISGQAAPTYATGSVEAFHMNTKTFYSQYQFIYDELERDLNYYSNLASVNSYVFQKLTSYGDGKSYEQFLWFTIDLMYENDRWWVVSVSWINETERSSIRSVMSEDTLWHDLSH